jgi:hypothetical protein
VGRQHGLEHQPLGFELRFRGHEAYLVGVHGAPSFSGVGRRPSRLLS